MRRVNYRLAILTTLLAGIVAATTPAGAQNAPLTIASNSLPATTVGSDYRFTFHASGGSQAYAWSLAANSQLPAGINLSQHEGKLSGTPTAPGEYHFTVILSDLSDASLRVQREFTLVVTAGLSIDWKQTPKVSGASLSGSVVVANHTDHAATLTVVVVAVNQIGRATTLGYQHFRLASQAEQLIPFGSSPGPGTYYVRADAVAGRRSSSNVNRVHKQTIEPLVIDTI
ncbi:MAG TPA: Ig domain-containing protein [Terriglobales bacterium]